MRYHLEKEEIPKDSEELYLDLLIVNQHFGCLLNYNHALFLLEFLI